MNNALKSTVALAALLIAISAMAFAVPVPAADAAKVAGEWNLTVESPNGTGTPSVIFKQDGETLTGTYKGRAGETTVKGTIQGNEIKFSATISTQGQEIQLDYAGVVDGDTMKGKVKFGEFGEGDFSGKKKGADAPAAK
ncbi:MAG TPA: hypothetical protein VNW97_24140 [Candidatus Saccharimonadales bacterium]|jgi:hypothetical protein|nr:hypothetical protein [Candidatus Saccharimonadales bacterium]